MKTTWRALAAGISLTLRLGAAAAEPEPAAREFRIADAWGRDTVEFRTSAPMEEIVGTTNVVRGTLRADPRKLASPATTARVEVDLKTLKTGIEMRDGHVAKALGAEKAPQAVFTLTRVLSAAPEAAEPNAPVDLTAEGTLELNGVKKPLPVAARVVYVPAGSPFSKMRPGNFVKLVATFELKLSDFGIERKGAVLPLQVGETAKVTVTALASDANAEEAKTYRESALKYLGKVMVEADRP